jgi:cytochrome c biogenesis protein CcmG/thiol:disulfide interchange protein DsbE
MNRAPNNLHETDDKNLADWVDERLTQLMPAPAWMPDDVRALARLNQRRAARIRRSRLSLWIAAAAAAASACLLVFPTSRDLLQRFWLGRSDGKTAYVGQVYADLKAMKDKQSAPDFTLEDARGNKVHLSDFRGRVVLLNFWATWCTGCKTEVPWLVTFEEKYKSKGLTVIGVAVDDDWPSLNSFSQRAAVNYPLLLDDGTASQTYEVYGMPSTYLIDRDGNISAASVGIIDRSECEKEILRLLGG